MAPILVFINDLASWKEIATAYETPHAIRIWRASKDNPSICTDSTIPLGGSGEIFSLRAPVEALGWDMQRYGERQNAVRKAPFLDPRSTQLVGPRVLCRVQ